MTRRGLGGAMGRPTVADLLPALAVTPEGGGERLLELAPAAIARSPFQPRTTFDRAKLRELADNITASGGVLQPVLVRERPGGGYELLAGERRLEAAKLAKLRSVPARVRQVDDVTAAAIALTENLAREDLTAWEEARGLARLRGAIHAATGARVTRDQLAKVTGRSTGAVSESLAIADRLTEERLRTLPPAIRQSVTALPKTTLLGAVRATDDAEMVALLAMPTAELRDRVAKPRNPHPGRPAEPFTWRERGGRLRLDLRQTPDQLAPAKARALADKLRPVLEALERRAGETSPPDRARTARPTTRKRT